MSGPAGPLPARAWAVVADAIGHLNADDGWAMASHVALSGLMAVFPFIIFVAALAGFVGQDALAARVVEILFATWPAEVAGPIAGEVQRILTPAHGRLLTVSAAVAVYLASNGVEAARTALNRAYRVVDRRPVLFRRLQSLAFVLVGAVSVLVLAALAVLGGVAFERLAAAVPALGPFEGAFGAARIAVTGVVLIAVLAGSHVLLPAGRPHWLRLWPGIAVTLGLWLASAWTFAAYLRSYANLAATYAGLAGVVTAIVFLYVIALALIFGAEFNASLGRLRERRIG
jgi:membrane protein